MKTSIIKPLIGRYFSTVYAIYLRTFRQIELTLNMICWTPNSSFFLVSMTLSAVSNNTFSRFERPLISCCKNIFFFSILHKRSIFFFCKIRLTVSSSYPVLTLSNKLSAIWPDSITISLSSFDAPKMLDSVDFRT